MNSVRWTNPRIVFLTLLLLIGSACRPSIDDNAPVPAASGGLTSIEDGSITTAKLANAAVTPEKLSNAYLPLAGGTMTGSLMLAGTPTLPLHAATKTYADGYLGGYSINSLSTITNGQVLGWNSTTSVWEPTTVSGGASATKIAVGGKNVDSTATTVTPANDAVLIYNTSVAGEWAAGTIVAGSIANNAVTTAKILDANVTTAKLAAGDPGVSGLVLTSTGASSAAWSSWSQGNIAFATKTANYTLTSSDNIIAVNTSGAGKTITLPTAASISGRQYTIKKIDSGAFDVTITPNGAETIDGMNTFVLSSQWQFVTLVSDGTNWQVMSNPVTQPGTIVPFAGATVPAGWLLCNAQAVSRTTYSALYTAIGTTWGVGDGATTFNVPDFRGIFLRGTGSHGTLTNANAAAFAGPSLGATQNDQLQGHWHNKSGATAAPVARSNGSGAAEAGVFDDYAFENAGQAHTITTSYISDGTNGTPRTGVETRPVNAGVNYIIKY